MIDMGLKLKCLRKYRGLSQKDLARTSGIGEKSISSFETGKRLDSLKISQLLALLAILDVPIAAFVLWDPEQTSMPMEHVVQENVGLPAVVEITSRRSLPVDPLARLRTRDDSRFPSPQSSLRDVM